MQKRLIDLLVHITQLIKRNNAKTILQKSSQSSVKFGINENTTASELIDQ